MTASPWTDMILISSVGNRNLTLKPNFKILSFRLSLILTLCNIGDTDGNRKLTLKQSRRLKVYYVLLEHVNYSEKNMLYLIE